MADNLSIEAEAALIEAVGEFIDDPLGFVMFAFPWDSDPSLQLVELDEPWASRYKSKYGPDKWACEYLDELGGEIKKRNFNARDAVDAIQMATASGHGIGKSTITAWLVIFIMATRPMAKGVVTANTSDQLRTKTWGELGKWLKKSIVAHWFEYNNGKGNMNMYHRDHQEGWRVDGQTCREENSESFAGLHSASSTPFYIFDEASAIPDVIWEVAEGGLTDGEPMWFAFGNPTRNTGRFHECFTKRRNRWICRKIDSRTVKITNKAKIEQWRIDYGEDSDFFKVRVIGEFPVSDVKQFISTELVKEAQAREAVSHPHEPLIMGIDPAAGGGDKWVIRFRRGNDARTIRAIKMFNPDPMTFAGIVAQHAQGSTHTQNQKVDAIFCDTGAAGWLLIKLIEKFGVSVIPVTFSHPSLRDDAANKRAQMWCDMRDGLGSGLAIDDDPQLHDDLIGPEVRYDKDFKWMLEKKQDMRDRGLDSPDDGDALALTYAYPVAPKQLKVKASQPAAEREWDPNS